MTSKKIKFRIAEEKINRVNWTRMRREPTNSYWENKLVLVSDENCPKWKDILGEDLQKQKDIV